MFGFFRSHHFIDGNSLMVHSWVRKYFWCLKCVDDY